MLLKQYFHQKNHIVKFFKQIFIILIYNIILACINLNVICIYKKSIFIEVVSDKLFYTSKYKIQLLKIIELFACYIHKSATISNTFNLQYGIA